MLGADWISSLESIVCGVGLLVCFGRSEWGTVHVLGGGWGRCRGWEARESLQGGEGVLVRKGVLDEVVGVRRFERLLTVCE